MDSYNPARRDQAEAENTEDSMAVSGGETDDGSPETRTTEDIRQGHTGDHVRYILLASVAGTVFVMAILVAWFFQ